MRENIIRKLFCGELQPASSRGYETKLYNERAEEFSILFKEIKALLPPEKHEKLDRLFDDHATMENERVIDSFINGFKLGMNLAFESMDILK